MATIFFCGDPHSRFGHIIRAVEAHRPDAVVLLGDQTAKNPLDVELASILDKTKVYWIPGNHDSDDELHYDNLFESGLKGRNIEDRVIAVAGITIAGIGGVFREKVWDGQVPGKYSPKVFVKTMGAGNKWRGGLPLRHRTTIFPSDIEQFNGMRVDVLVTHEAPDLHRIGNVALTRLAQSLHVRKAFHGHHHQMIEYPGGVWQGVSLCGIVALDTVTFETSVIDQGIVSTKAWPVAEPLAGGTGKDAALGALADAATAAANRASDAIDTVLDSVAASEKRIAAMEAAAKAQEVP